MPVLASDFSCASVRHSLTWPWSAPKHRDIVDLSMHADMRQPAFSIYQAFDAGEYWHSGDDRDVFPWEK